MMIGKLGAEKLLAREKVIMLFLSMKMPNISHEVVFGFYSAVCRLALEVSLNCSKIYQRPTNGLVDGSKCCVYLAVPRSVDCGCGFSFGRQYQFH